MYKKKSSKTLKEIKASISVMQALGLANNVRDIKLNNRLEHHVTVESESTVKLLYCSLLKGGTTKTNSREKTRFTTEQKRFMEQCFDVGELDKKNRYTAQSCERLTKEQLGEKRMLSQRQIKSYCSAYKRKNKIQTQNIK